MQLSLSRSGAELYLESVNLAKMAEHVPTPFYAYSRQAIVTRVSGLQQALTGLDARICFAVKANSNRAILNLMATLGVGADIVSSGELQRSLAAGIPADKIVFSGVGKTAAEIAEALACGVARFNVESRDELALMQQLAKANQRQAICAIRINPDVDAGTHEKISTGKSENKFGVSIAEARQCFTEAKGYSHVQLNGLHVHIGSQILTLAPFQTALARVAAFWQELVATGHHIESIDVGGGLGVRYRNQEVPVAATDYVRAIREALGEFRGQLLLEPGRYLVAEAGVLVSQVIRVKQGENRSFLVLDAAMNDLLRPSLYDAWHDILAAIDSNERHINYDVVGPVCETGDTFARQRELPQLRSGDMVVIAGAGAYGSTMSSSYNSRPLLAEWLIDGAQFALIRRRQTIAEMVAGESLATDWQQIG